MKPERTRRAAVAAMAKPRRPVHREKWPGYWKYSFRSRLVMARKKSTVAKKARATWTEARSFIFPGR